MVWAEAIYNDLGGPKLTLCVALAKHRPWFDEAPEGAHLADHCRLILQSEYPVLDQSDANLLSQILPL